MRLASGAFEGPYSSKKRFEEDKGTNPEELVGAAHAGCFSMALAARLEKAGHTAKNIDTKAKVELETTDGDIRISQIDLTTEADVPEIEEDEFQKLAEDAKRNCPVSKALSGTEITLRARVVHTAAS